MSTRTTTRTVSAVQRCQLDAGEQKRLQEWADRIQASISHADTKASILLGLSGTALALLPAKVLPNGLLSHLSWLPASRTGWAYLIGAGAAVIGLGLLGACVVVLILAVRPDLGTEPVCGSPVGAGHLTAGEIAVLVVEASQDDATAQALHIGRLSRIATRKHQRVRTATTLLLACLPPLVLCAAVAVTS